MKRMTITMLATLWVDDKRQYTKQSTVATYVFLLKNHILPSFGNKSQMVEQDVKEFISQKQADGLSPKYIKDILRVLKMIQRFGEHKGALPRQDWVIRLPSPTSAKGLKVMEGKHQQLLMNYLTSHMNPRNLGIYLCLCTGIRIGELCALKWGDVDTDNAAISISRTLQRIYIANEHEGHTILQVGVPKSRCSFRNVPIGKELLPMLKQQKQLASDGCYILTQKNTPMEPHSFRIYYNSLLQRLGLPHLHFHGLRHTFATRCVENHCDYKALSTILGHSNVATTLNLYVHPSISLQRSCIDNMLTAITSTEEKV